MKILVNKKDNKYKVCVYAICKNESKFIDRWVDSMNEADNIVVLDTGSTDDTVKKLRTRNIKVKIKKIEPFRFDKARNESMKLIPKNTDICVCTDLDEVFEKGWREKLERLWNKDINIIKYRYVWSFTKDQKEGVVFYINKIHKKNDFIWKYPVHEVLEYIGKDSMKQITTSDINLYHYPDDTKPRKYYLELLELAVKENPEDPRCMHYLGREYMYNYRYKDAISILKKYLKLNNANWKPERAATMRYISRCYIGINKKSEAKEFLKKAIIEAPYLRDAYVELAYVLQEEKDNEGVISYLEKALEIKEKSDEYINEDFSWNEAPYDMLAVAYYNIGNKEKALENVKKALKYSNEERIQNNLKSILKM